MQKVIILLCSVFIILFVGNSASPAKIYNTSGISNSKNPHDTLQKECIGELASQKGKTLKMYFFQNEDLPALGALGILAKYFEEEVLGFYSHGYIDIAEVEVKDIDDGEVTFTILKELSSVRVNGKKESFFKQGNMVKFSW